MASVIGQWGEKNGPRKWKTNKNSIRKEGEEIKNKGDKAGKGGGKGEAMWWVGESSIPASWLVAGPRRPPSARGGIQVLDVLHHKVCPDQETFLK